MLAIGLVTTVCFYSTRPFVYPFAVHTLTLHALHIKNLTLYEQICAMQGLRKKLRNPGIACQSTDSYFAQRNPKIARLPGLRGT